MAEETESSKEKSERKMTPEEMENYKNNLIKFYKAQMEMLEPQLAYERAITEVDELRARRMLAQIRLAEMMAPEPKEDEPGKVPPVPTDKIETPDRKLKKEPA